MSETFGFGPIHTRRNERSGWFEKPRGLPAGFCYPLKTIRLVMFFRTYRFKPLKRILTCQHFNPWPKHWSGNHPARGLYSLADLEMEKVVLGGEGVVPYFSNQKGQMAKTLVHMEWPCTEPCFVGHWFQPSKQVGSWWFGFGWDPWLLLRVSWEAIPDLQTQSEGS